MSTPADAAPALPWPGAVSATLGRRFAAICVDWLASLILARLLLPWLSWDSAQYSLAVLGVFFVEVVIFTWLTASSFGQRILGIAVVGVTGRRLGLWWVLVRTALICLVIPALVYDSRRRGLQDLVAGSVVVMRASLPGLGR